MARPVKALGQNFLRHRGLARRIAEALEATAEDTVVEIGPGEGALSEWLVQLPHRRLLAVEYDRRLAGDLAERYAGRMEIVRGDILGFDLEAAAAGGPLRVIGNIPYHLTSPILFHLLAVRRHIRRAVLMVQKEVAERVLAPAGNKTYGVLSILVQLQAAVVQVAAVGRRNFYPVPGVDSAVLALDMKREVAGVDDFELLRAVVRRAFQNRRKMLRNSLGEYLAGADSSGIPLTARPEELTPEEWVRLANRLAAGRTQL